MLCNWAQSRGWAFPALTPYGEIELWVAAILDAHKKCVVNEHKTASKHVLSGSLRKRKKPRSLRSLKSRFFGSGPSAASRLRANSIDTPPLFVRQSACQTKRVSDRPCIRQTVHQTDRASDWRCMVSVSREAAVRAATKRMVIWVC